MIASFPSKKQILIVDDEINLRRILSAQLAREGYDVLTAQDGRKALELLHENHIDLVITDLKMPHVDGIELLRATLQEDRPPRVVMITAHGTVDTAVEALKLGAFDYLTKPFDRMELRQVVAKALHTQILLEEEAPKQTSSDARFGIVGHSLSIKRLCDVLDRVANTPTTVLVTGESGTGKELVARALHEHSARKEKPLIKVNCAAIPTDLIESELFGYERGAFTGAVTSKPGRFELAHGGTLFLDEIGEVPLDMQAKLLRVLQESEFERVGGIKTLHVDVRLIAATNRDLRKRMLEGAFREDLFYRLNVIPIVLAPLRERAEDIPTLADYFLQKSNEKLKKQVLGFSVDALTQLCSYLWPGNIRELENVVERAVLFCDDPYVGIAHLPEEVCSLADVTLPQTFVHGGEQKASMPLHHELWPSTKTLAGEGLKEQVRVATSRLEREWVRRALQQTGGNVTHAARLLKISRKGLQLKMKELALREGSSGETPAERQSSPRIGLLVNPPDDL